MYYNINTTIMICGLHVNFTDIYEIKLIENQMLFTPIYQSIYSATNNPSIIESCVIESTYKLP